MSSIAALTQSHPPSAMFSLVVMDRLQREIYPDLLPLAVPGLDNMGSLK